MGILKRPVKSRYSEDSLVCVRHMSFTILTLQAAELIFMQKPTGKRGWDCIHSTPTMTAGFPHFYYYGNPELPKAFLDCSRDFKKRQSGGLEK